jgi:hypothetical protein
MNPILSQFAGVAPGGAIPTLGGSTSGALAQFEDLQKALQASNYQTDVANLTGGGALGVQSLDTAMKTTIQENEHFVLFNRLAKTNATNIVDEYTRQNGVGGFLGGTTNTQLGVVRAAQGDYAREVGLVKFLMSLRQVGYVLNIGKNITEATAVEERNGALQLLTDAEYLLFHGNASACPTQFDGIFAQLDKEIAAGNMGSDHVIDMNGGAVNSVDPFSQVNVAVMRYGSWGRLTDALLPISVQNDLNQGLDPAFRWMPGQNNTPMIGAHVEGIRLQGGVVKTAQDTFLHDENHPMVSPFQVSYSATATANAAINPASLTGSAANDSASMFTSTRAGNYYYAVEAIDSTGAGMSQLAISAQVAVASGQSVTLTITKSSAGTESGYRIFRSKQNGDNTPANFRLMTVVAKAAGNTTTYVDQNREIPGTVKIPLLDMAPGADAIGWRQFQPMTKIPLPFGVGGVPVISWFQFLFGYLRITKPKRHGYIKNVLPTKAVWRPFTAE